MANRPALLKQSEMTRYLKASKTAGNEGGRVEVKPDGTHLIFKGDPEAPSVPHLKQDSH